MALIQCPECQKEYSEHASSCPNCGYSHSRKTTKDTVDRVNNTVKETSNTLKPWLMLIGGIAISLFGIIYLLSDKNNSMMRTILVIGGGIALIVSAINLLKKQQ